MVIIIQTGELDHTHPEQNTFVLDRVAEQSSLSAAAPQRMSPAFACA